MGLVTGMAKVLAAKVLIHTSKEFAFITQYRTLRRAGLDHQSIRRRLFDSISSPDEWARVETYLIRAKILEIREEFPDGGLLAIVALREFIEQEFILSAREKEVEG